MTWLTRVLHFLFADCDEAPWDRVVGDNNGYFNNGVMSFRTFVTVIQE